MQLFMETSFFGLPNRTLWMPTRGFRRCTLYQLFWIFFCLNLCLCLCPCLCPLHILTARFWWVHLLTSRSESWSRSAAVFPTVDCTPVPITPPHPIPFQGKCRSRELTSLASSASATMQRIRKVSRSLHTSQHIATYRCSLRLQQCRFHAFCTRMQHIDSVCFVSLLPQDCSNQDIQRWTQTKSIVWWRGGDSSILIRHFIPQIGLISRVVESEHCRLVGLLTRA